VNINEEKNYKKLKRKMKTCEMKKWKRIIEWESYYFVYHWFLDESNINIYELLFKCFTIQPTRKI